ncbi:MAG: CRISPR-associated endonuclease Cas2 [Alicyclobacillus herbarius]|uniref:CRISPR-associated endonuclease Cas2 n=1 Tax=Alicyclobacillus herbarius TaxID=122960 RepID=UPI00041AAF12|nr:CRISPR-associated endonuclease Cas2 [Alicyclobacillus herbarius]MCL6633314.1 CRISPR-associated endonuclease Cas2 [Alicyclobacillus herbarius]
MNLLIAYDISTETKQGQKRLRRVAKVCLNYGQRVQHSVFECQLDELAFSKLVQSLSEIVHPTEDNIRIYRVTDLSRGSVINLGRIVGIDYKDPIVL